MQTHQIHVVNGRETVHEIRRQLFVFPEVIEVFETGRPEALVVVYVGRPRPGEWLRALRSVGYHTPARVASWRGPGLAKTDRGNRVAEVRPRGRTNLPSLAENLRGA